MAFIDHDEWEGALGPTELRALGESVLAAAAWLEEHPGTA
jgi:hypothetical protein